MPIQISFDPRQLAEKWVAKTVLLGCILITVGLVYVAYKANALGQQLSQKSSVASIYDEL
jgi:hypothetical protein